MYPRLNNRACENEENEQHWRICFMTTVTHFSDDVVLHSSPSDKRKLISQIILFGLVCASIYHFVIMSFPPLSSKKPYDTFLFHPEERFSDLYYMMHPYERDMNPAAMISYFPASFLLIEPLALLGRFALPAYIVVSSVGIAILIYKTLQVGSAQERWYFLAAMMLSYPMLFTLDRANIESFLLILVFLWWRMRATGKEVLAALFLGLAGATKLYPLLYLLPDLVNFRWYRLFLTAGFVALFSLLGLMLLPESPAECIRLLSRTMKFGHDVLVHRHIGVPYSTSGLSFIKFVIAWCFSGNLDLAKMLIRVCSEYCYIGSISGIIVMLLAGWKLRKKEEWKLVFVAAAAMMLLTPISFDYKLLHLFLPCILFINSKSEAGDYLLAVLFGLLLIPKAYWFMPAYYISTAVFINPLLICLIFSLVVRGRLMVTTHGSG